MGEGRLPFGLLLQIEEGDTLEKVVIFPN